MDEGGEALVGLVGAQGDAFELLELAEEILDHMSHLYISASMGGRAARKDGPSTSGGTLVVSKRWLAAPI